MTTPSNNKAHSMVPVPHRTESRQMSSQALSMPEGQCPVKQEHRAESKNAIQLTPATAKSGGSREAELDFGLWTAIQTITTARRERAMIYSAHSVEQEARATLARDLSALQKKFELVNGKYNEMFRQYKTLYNHHETLRSQYDGLRTDFTKAHEDQIKLEAIGITLQQEKIITKSLESRLQSAQNELSEMEDWCAEELRGRDEAIDMLKEDIRDKDTRLAQHETKIESLERHNQNFLDKTIKVSQLEEAVTACELIKDKLRDDLDALTSENELATEIIQALERVQREMESDHSEVVRQLKEDNMNLRNTLNEAIGWSREQEGQLEALKGEYGKEKQQLRDENISLTRKLEDVTQALVARFPNLHGTLENISSVLDSNGEERRRKRRCVK